MAPIGNNVERPGSMAWRKSGGLRAESQGFDSETGLSLFVRACGHFGPKGETLHAPQAM